MLNEVVESSVDGFLKDCCHTFFMSSGDDWEKFGKYKFEYQELREEIKRNTQMDYVLMSIFVAASLLIIGNAYAVYYDNFYSNYTNCTNNTQPPTVGLVGIQTPVLFGPYLLSLSLLIIAWLIDKRLTAFNKIKGCRMHWLEVKLGIYNKRLALKDGEKTLIKDGDKVRYEVYVTENWFDGVKKVNEGSFLMSFGPFLRLRVSDYFLLLIGIINIGWFFLFSGWWIIIPLICAYLGFSYFLVALIDC